jgi:hypothetical protein
MAAFTISNPKAVSRLPTNSVWKHENRRSRGNNNSILAFDFFKPCATGMIMVPILLVSSATKSFHTASTTTGHSRFIIPTGMPKPFPIERLRLPRRPQSEIERCGQLTVVSLDHHRYASEPAHS